SVGIGFGLQNVINNFVSGLILLAERPIKPGDWVVIGGHEGKVKKVNVRSTEVETFQRASVIIPNADLISTPVINWTHKNMLGRVEVAVGVAYGTDPRLVEQVLVDCANAHPNVLKGQDPYVLFTNFGESSLDFELRAFLVDVEKRVLTGSELRFAIHDALKEKGIEIPFPQRVIHMAAPPA
ncbi:MAG: mechanosensitive ion channel, partial [Rhodospirillales bacterium]|nr:mechanosensitive ion channel [Rhodospirillales bacterium]MCW8970922.1 mechanosensitive ion channel [Rhodospirillales bacterium]